VDNGVQAANYLSIKGESSRAYSIRIINGHRTTIPKVDKFCFRYTDDRSSIAVAEKVDASIEKN